MKRTRCADVVDAGGPLARGGDGGGARGGEESAPLQDSEHQDLRRSSRLFSNGIIGCSGGGLKMRGRDLRSARSRRKNAEERLG